MYSPKIYTDLRHLLQSFLKAVGVTYIPTPHPETFQLEHTAVPEGWISFVQFREQGNQAIFLTQLKAMIPEQHRRDIALLLTHLNFGMFHGNLEMDLKNGELRYRSSLILGELKNPEWAYPMFEPVLWGNLYMANRCTPAIREVLSGEKTPAEAAAKIKADTPAGT